MFETGVGRRRGTMLAQDDLKRRRSGGSLSKLSPYGTGHENGSRSTSIQASGLPVACTGGGGWTCECMCAECGAALATLVRYKKRRASLINKCYFPAAKTRTCSGPGILKGTPPGTSPKPRHVMLPGHTCMCLGFRRCGAFPKLQ